MSHTTASRAVSVKPPLRARAACTSASCAASGPPRPVPDPVRPPVSMPCRAVTTPARSRANVSEPPTRSGRAVSPAIQRYAVHGPAYLARLAEAEWFGHRDR
ncbi:hypothetical protein GCM10027614_74230 [Micromonospora vulcania]